MEAYIKLPKVEEELRQIALHSYEVDHTLNKHNYFGPGTPVITNILDEVQPTNDNDFYAMLHDYEYIMAQTPQDILNADDRFNNNVDGVNGTFAKWAMKLKNVLGVERLQTSNYKFTDDQRALLDYKYAKIKQKYGKELDWSG